MTYLPDPVVTVNGVDYTDKSLWDVQINYGRTTVWEQARAGYAIVRVVNLNDSNFNFQINDDLVVTVKNSTGTPITVFTGRVNDISNTLTNVGTTATVGVQTLSALAPFAFMARKIVGTSAYPKEYDDDRMATIFAEAGVTVDVVDTPGVYEFTARAANQPTDAYSLSALYAGMALGYIYETTDGKVGYANESHRLNEVGITGYFEIPLNYILGQGVSSNLSLNDITNDILLTYKANATKTASDAGSIAAYGLQAGSISTELENAAEAQYQVDRYIALRANPNTNLSSFSIMLDSSNLTAADRNALLAVYMGQAIEILDLPNSILHIVYRGFVEGWQMSINQYQVSLTLTTTDSSLSIPPTRWQDVSALLQWEDVDPTLQWFAYE
jgi:hypothetical protein